MPCYVTQEESIGIDLASCKRKLEESNNQLNSYARGFCELSGFLKRQYPQVFDHAMTNRFIQNLYAEHAEVDRQRIIKTLLETYPKLNNYTDEIVYQLYEDGVIKLLGEVNE